ncbi:MAG: pyridoxal-phosphate dependent enzyme, partial [Acidobacteriia bacterium]|nr:pyridoxal-phosphate dependent enzyme [Terriglobia bacterium]
MLLHRFSFCKACLVSSTSLGSSSTNRISTGDFDFMLRLLNGFPRPHRAESIPQDRRAGGVVAYSSGNNAQGVAAAARLLGMSAVIVMPSDAPRPKRERTVA